MSRRSRSSGGRGGLAAVLAVVLVAFVVVSPLPAVSSPVGELGRSAGVGVDADEDGLVALNVSTELQTDATNCLVVLTNNLDHAATATVTLHPDARDRGDLVVPPGGSGNGDSVTVDVGTGDRQRIDLSVAANTSGTTVGFDVGATTTEGSVDLPARSSPITETGAPDTCA